jgi:hypothetical protein
MFYNEIPQIAFQVVPETEQQNLTEFYRATLLYLMDEQLLNSSGGQLSPVT